MNTETCKNVKQQFEQAARILAPGHPFIQQAPIKPNPGPPASIKGRLSLSHAISVVSAELWLRLGDADGALRELEALPRHAWNHPSAVEVRIAALEVLDERTGAIGQAVQE